MPLLDEGPGGRDPPWPGRQLMDLPSKVSLGDLYLAGAQISKPCGEITTLAGREPRHPQSSQLIPATSRYGRSAARAVLISSRLGHIGVGIDGGDECVYVVRTATSGLSPRTQRQGLLPRRLTAKRHIRDVLFDVLRTGRRGVASHLFCRGLGAGADVIGVDLRRGTWMK